MTSLRKTKSVRDKISNIIFVFTLGMLIILGIIIYGIMNELSNVVPLLRGERITNAVAVRDAEIHFKDYMFTGSDESKEEFLLSAGMAYSSGLYGDLLNEKINLSELIRKMKSYVANAKYEQNALTDKEIEDVVALGYNFKNIGRIRKLLELARGHKGHVEKMFPIFEQLVKTKNAPMDEGLRQEKVNAIDSKMQKLLDEMYSYGAEFSKYTGELAYWTIRMITLVIAALVGIFIITGSSIGLRISNSITTPLAKLMKASREVAKGNMDYRAEVRSDDEIGELADSFNQMTAELKESRKHMEDYNKKLEEEVKKRTQELKDAQAQIIQSAKMSAVGQLGAGVAHELNNPLGGVLGYAQFILEKLKSPDFSPDDFKSCQKYIESIERESARCKNIVANLLKFSRRPITFNPEPVNIKEALEETLGIVGHQLKLKNIKVMTEIQPGLAQVTGVVNQLQQIFTNLILNAQQAMPDGGEMNVKAENIIDENTKTPSHIKLVFSDTGTGIKPEALSKIFDPFFTTKQKDKGTGLGLSVVYEIIQAHHGKIDVASEVGKGTTFTIVLPAIDGGSKA